MNSSGLKFVLGGLAVVGLAVACYLLMPVKGQVETGPQSLFFGRILLGPDKSNESMVYRFIVQGGDLYVDENKDNIPQAGELDTDGRLPLIEDVAAGVSYDVSGIRLGLAPENVSDTLPQQVAVTVDVAGKQPFTQAGSIVMTRDPATSNWLHFNGPLQMLYVNDAGLHKGSKRGTEVKVYLGTIADAPTLENGESGDFAEEDLMKQTAIVIPNQSTPFPHVSIKYESEDGPIVQELDLDTFC